MESLASPKTITPFYALIVAGGSGSRLGGAIPKQYQKIAGKAILRHTVDAFLACADLQALCVVIDPAHQDYYDSAVKGLDLPPPVEGGNDRKSSVYNGLSFFSNLKNKDIILVHDAARPLVRVQDIENVAAQAAARDAATLALPVADTQKYEDGAYIKRDGLWSIQTPQGFQYGLLRDAHEKELENKSFTDDSALIEALGRKVALVKGSRRNFKITTPEDMAMARNLMTRHYETRTGFGYDVHRFTEGANVRLCGTYIPHSQKLDGHSDADAALHALTDALLGTIGAGDIGTYFPPSDPQWKDADSAVFLRKAVDMIEDKGGIINNVDLTIICEEPKIGPYREAMQHKVAALCGLSPDRVGLKATTNEKLGFLGRGEGIAVQAVASVRFPEDHENAEQ